MLKKLINTILGKNDKALNEAKKEVSGLKRSNKWSKIQKEHLQMEPKCAACGKDSNEVTLQVHHKFPFHYCIALGRPDLELDHRNLITLCETSKDKNSENHHLLLGHLDNFKSSNLNVEEDCKTYYNLTSEQIQENKTWEIEEKNRLKLLTEMSEEEKEDFKNLMNKKYPLI